MFAIDRQPTHNHPHFRPIARITKFPSCLTSLRRHFSHLIRLRTKLTNLKTFSKFYFLPCDNQAILLKIFLIRKLLQICRQIGTFVTLNKDKKYFSYLNFINLIGIDRNIDFGALAKEGEEFNFYRRSRRPAIYIVLLHETQRHFKVRLSRRDRRLIGRFLLLGSARRLCRPMQAGR